MKISFIIVTFDKDITLNQCIDSIARAHEAYPQIPIEIVIVSQDPHRLPQIDPRFVQLTNFFSVASRSLSVARNLGIKQCTGDYLVFLDDDAAIQEDFIAAVNSFVAKQGALVFCGKILDSVSHELFAKHFEKNEVIRLNRLRFRLFMGSAHIVHKGIFTRYGTYDTVFGIGSDFFGAEESDLFFRLKSAGQSIVYLPGLVFFHPKPESKLDPKVRGYSYAIGAMLAKQCWFDPKRSSIYAWIFLDIFLRNVLRALQYIAASDSRGRSCYRYHRLVIEGTIYGAMGYIRERIKGISCNKTLR